MNILAVGDKRRCNELSLKLPKSNALSHSITWEAVSPEGYDLIFDLNFDDFPNNMKYFADSTIPVFACAVKKRLTQAVNEYGSPVACPLIGINALPEFINREIIEVSIYGKNESIAERLLMKLGWKFRIVEDRAGLVSPRIVCMIINEACCALQEGTASIQDIDLAMKLGTNYPYGPFEWADKIGIKEVYETLEAIYLDTHDERYKHCPLLKTKYLNRENFY